MSRFQKPITFRGHFTGHPPLKLLPNYIKGCRPHIQKKGMKAQRRVGILQGFSCLFFHVGDFQVAGVVFQIIGRIFRDIVVDGGNHLLIADGKKLVQEGAHLLQIPAFIMDIDIQKGVESQGKGAVVGQQFPQSRGQAVVQAVGVVFHIGGPPFGVAGET